LIQVPGIGSAAELKANHRHHAQLTFNPVVNRRPRSEKRCTGRLGQFLLP